MSNPTTAADQNQEPMSDTLLVLDKEQKKIRAVKEIKDGELQTLAPTPKNSSQFLRIDKSGNLLSNFFSNFFSQLKDPSRFSFFWTPVSESESLAKRLQQHVDQPTEEGRMLMQQYDVQANYQTKNPGKMEQQTTEANEYRYQPEQVNWKAMSEIGLSKEKLEKMNLLEPLLKGYKTNELVPLNLNFGVVVTRVDARLSLQANDDGQVVVNIHGIRKEPRLDYPFLGHEFTKEDKENLLATGNMGRVVDLTNPRTLETLPSIISVDRLTNELIPLRADRIKIPDEIKGIILTEEQKQTLAEGKPLYLEGMISKKGEPFDATVQFNADKRYVEFLFDRDKANRQDHSQTQSPEPATEPSKIFRGKELDDKQYEKLQAGQTVYVSGLVDRKGKEYQGYITFNAGTGKTDFSFEHPDKLKEKAQPAEAYKTQTAVNSEGKTNEATKNIKEPLKPGQQAPDNKKQQEQQQQKPAKSKGRKM